MRRDVARLTNLAAKLATVRRQWDAAELGSLTFWALSETYREIEAEFVDLEHRHVAAGGQPWRPTEPNRTTAPDEH